MLRSLSGLEQIRILATRWVMGPMEYALRDPKVWAKIRNVKPDYKPIDLRNRMPIPRKKARKCIEVIPALSENPQP